MTTVRAPAQAPSPYQKKVFTVLIGFVLHFVVRLVSVQATANGEIIEDYPDDYYGPSCLISGTTANDRPLHIQCSYPASRAYQYASHHTGSIQSPKIITSSSSRRHMII